MPNPIQPPPPGGHPENTMKALGPIRVGDTLEPLMVTELHTPAGMPAPRFESPCMIISIGDGEYQPMESLLSPKDRPAVGSCVPIAVFKHPHLGRRFCQVEGLHALLKRALAIIAEDHPKPVGNEIARGSAIFAKNLPPELFLKAANSFLDHMDLDKLELAGSEKSSLIIRPALQ